MTCGVIYIMYYVLRDRLLEGLSLRVLRASTKEKEILPPFLNISHIVFSTNINARLEEGCETEKKRKIRPSSLSQSSCFINLRD